MVMAAATPTMKTASYQSLMDGYLPRRRVVLLCEAWVVVLSMLIVLVVLV